MEGLYEALLCFVSHNHLLILDYEKLEDMLNANCLFNNGKIISVSLNADKASITYIDREEMSLESFRVHEVSDEIGRKTRAGLLRVVK